MVVGEIAGEVDIKSGGVSGELTGGLFYNNYPGGSGPMAGAVLGRIAGAQEVGYAVKP